MNLIDLWRVRFLLDRRCWVDFAVVSNGIGGYLEKREGLV